MNVTPADFQSTLDALPTVIDTEVVLDLDAGTYPAADLSRFLTTGRGRIVLSGYDAVLDGSVSDTVRGQTWDAAVLVKGCAVALVGVTVSAPTGGHGVWAHSGARLTLTDVLVQGGDKGLAVWDGSSLELTGTVDVTGFASRGIQIGFGSRAGAGGVFDLAVIGPGKTSTAYGIHMVDTSHFVMHAQGPTGCSVSVDTCGVGIQCGLNAIWTHQGPSGITVLEDCATGVMATDCSSWSTNRPLTYRRITSQKTINSMSYYEAVGGVNVTSTGGTP